MAGVFVSYAREDAAKAKAIAREIGQAGFDVWIDERIGSGSEYSREIERALADASAVVVVWSRNSVDSPWVRDEAAEGRDSGRLVPLLIDECRPPMGFRQFQTTDLSHWSGRRRPKELADVISAIRAKAGAPPRPIARPAVTARWKRPMAWGMGGLAAAVVAVAAFLSIGRVGTTPAAEPSLAILPFTADASDTDSRKLASAARDAVAHTLSQGAFAVSTVDTPLARGAAPADYLVTGQVTSTPDKFITTVRMEEATHRFVVFSHQFESSRDKAGGFPELIGAQVASQLSWTAPMLAIERQHPSDPAITATLLQGGSAGLDNVGDLGSYERARRLAAKAPDSPLAQSGLAFNAAFALGQLPQDQRAEAVALGRKAYERALALAPEFGGNYIPWCLLHSEQRRIECENHLRAGMQADPDGAFTNFFLAVLLVDVGRNKEATELARVSLAHDPYMPHKIGIMLRMLEITGQTQEAADLYRQAVRWWPGSEALLWRRFTGMIARGDFKAAQQFEKELGEKKPPSAALSAINRNSPGLLRTACAAPKEAEMAPCLLGLARIGDLDAAFGLADRIYPSRRGRTPAEEERIWLDNPDTMPTMFLTSPAAVPLRRDPRYLALAERVGLLEYWRSGRLPDFCTIQHEPVCAKLARP
jgi:TolB-like protein/tetratricopeptide (TPR) repeat protein